MNIVFYTIGVYSVTSVVASLGTTAELGIGGENIAQFSYCGMLEDKS